jgi:small GTP-binding protein
MTYKVKIVLLGEAAVGKTSLVYRFVKDTFRESYKSTLGVNLLKKELDIEGYGETSAQIWDLGGQESFKNLRQLYLEGANGALLIYDVTNTKSFEKLDEWMESFTSLHSDEPILLIGNKIDLENRIKISEKEAKNYAKENGVKLLLTSAKNGENVETAFEELIKTILDKLTK